MFLLSMLHTFMMFLLIQRSNAPVVTDITPILEVHTDGQWLPYIKEEHWDANKVRLRIDPCQYTNYQLHVESNEPFRIYFNKFLMAHTTCSVLWQIDSMIDLYATTPWQLVFYNENGLKGIRVSLISPPQHFAALNTLRANTSYSQFLMIASLILLICFVLVMKVSPSSRFRYLSLYRIFFSSDKSRGILPIATILSYLLAVLLVAFVYLVALENTQVKSYQLQHYNIESILEGLYIWGKLSFLFGVLLGIKIMFVAMFSVLFKMSDNVNTYASHYFGVLLSILSIAGIISLFMIALNINQPSYYNFILFSILVLPIVWMTISLYRSLRTSHFTFIYLFSYLCILEIIPALLAVGFLNS